MDESADETALLREVAPWLGDDESIVWIGRPDPRRFRWEYAGAMVFGAIALIAALIATVTVAVVLATRPAGLPLTGLSFPVLFFLGLRGVTAPYRAVGEGTVYVVTTDRAIILNGFESSTDRNARESSPRDRAFEAPALRRRQVKRRRRDGSGDVIFDVRVATRDGRPIDSLETGFFGVPRVDEVDRILERVAAGGKGGKKDDPDPDFA